jgi:hypothetical protein
MKLSEANEIAIKEYLKKYPLSNFKFSRATLHDMINTFYQEFSG